MRKNKENRTPSVALIKPPSVAPTRKAISSVANPNNLANGTMAKKDTKKMAISFTFAK